MGSLSAPTTLNSETPGGPTVTVGGQNVPVYTHDEDSPLASGKGVQPPSPGLSLSGQPLSQRDFEELSEESEEWKRKKPPERVAL